MMADKTNGFVFSITSIALVTFCVGSVRVLNRHSVESASIPELKFVSRIAKIYKAFLKTFLLPF